MRIAQAILETIHAQFYAAGRPDRFHRDRPALLYALTWPAHWLDRRGLCCSPERYGALINDRLAAIRTHGDPTVWSEYFPRYLLKCLQDFFQRHGDDLDHNLRHIAHAVASVQASILFAEPSAVQARQIQALALAHRLLHARHHPIPPNESAQMRLFL